MGILVNFNLVTIFPEFFETPLSCGLVGKAKESGLVRINLVNPRDFAEGRHRSVDDRPYGGGPGMVMMPGPTAAALRSIENPGRGILLSPRGRPLTQKLAADLVEEEHLTLVCGRYEGIDQRLIELFAMDEISVGDFVLNGGEAAALCLVESVSRLLPGFMGHDQSPEDESFARGLLEHPHYTRPEVFEGLPVPDVLLSGDHAAIAEWRRKQALIETLRKRPELLADAELGRADSEYLAGESRLRLGRNLYVGLVHYPVINKNKKVKAVSLTNLDIHDISRVSRTYGLPGFYIVTPLEDQQRLAARLIDHWIGGKGGKVNPDRAAALSLIRIKPDLDRVLDDIESERGTRPRIVATGANVANGLTVEAVRSWVRDHPVLLLLGTAWGLAPQIMDRADGVLRPIRFLDDYNHLSVRAAAAVFIDRLLSDVY